MARNERARVLRPRTALDRRFREVAELADDAEQRAATEPDARTARRQQPRAHRGPRGHGGHELRHRALDRLLWADRRRELMAAHRRADDIRGSLADPGDADDVEQELVAERRGVVQQDAEPEQPADI